MNGAQCNWLVAKSFLESTSIPYGCWVLSWLFHFPSRFLLVHWESSTGWPNALGPCTHVGDTNIASDQLSPRHCSHLENTPVDRKIHLLTLHF